MERVDKRALIGFWELVESLKTANKVPAAAALIAFIHRFGAGNHLFVVVVVRQNEVPQIVGELYQKFFVESREIPVEKFLLREIQQSLVGNTGTQVFIKLQEQVTIFMFVFSNTSMWVFFFFLILWSA